MSYIFGSFARRRKSQEPSGSSKRRSDTSRDLNQDRLSPHHSKKKMTSFQRLSNDDTKLRCPICKKQFEDPRILPCLHTFCLKCIQQLENENFHIYKEEEDQISSSAGSGYISEHLEESTSCNKGAYCPSCGTSIEFPQEGAVGFLPNFLVQQKIQKGYLEAEEKVCDVCTSDKSVTFRCVDCCQNLCDVCEEIHQRQKHQILTVNSTKEYKRIITCLIHQDVELNIFCSTCYKVICKECVSFYHKDHVCESVSKAIKDHFAKLRFFASKAKNVVEESAVASSKLNTTYKKVENQCNNVQIEVEKFIEEYIQSVENHKKGLLNEIKEVREEKLQHITQEKEKLQKKLREARDVSYFLSDLLNEGTDTEILFYLQSILKKVENCGNFESINNDLKLSGSLQFLKEETVKCPNNFYTIYGVLTTQCISPENCILNTAVLQNLRVGKKVEILLETRDYDDAPIERGGEEVTAEIRHREAGMSKSLNVNVKDKRNGTYVISFIPDVPGKLILNVNIKGQPVKGSPFPVNVRTIKQHIGLYHCCTFCSSRGSKDATCGCAGTMPGGYKGCGHGHEGHPGRRHWSCCGNILEHSECTRIKQNNYENN